MPPEIRQPRLPLDDELLAQLADSGVRARRLSAAEHRDHEAAWRRAYGWAFRNRLGHRDGERAVHEFLHQPEERWSLVPFLSDVPGTPVSVRGPAMSAFACDGPLVAMGAFGNVEFFVSPPDLSWTFVHTHEDFAPGGPFFVRAEWLGTPPRSGPAGEREFWLLLEFRLCGEFAGLRDKSLRALWCDGFAPEDHLIDGDGARVTGTAWIAHGSGAHERWRFVLLVGRRLTSWEDVDWDRLLPPEHVTGWLAMDWSTKTMRIDPAAAYPDPPAPAKRAPG